MLTRYLWDYATNTCLAEMDEQGETLVDYTVDPQTGELISENHGGQEVYHRYDGEGNTRQTADSAGNVLGEATYDAFGEVVAESGDLKTTYRFRGKGGFSTDPVTRGVSQGNSNYCSSLGRLLSPIANLRGQSYSACLSGTVAMCVPFPIRRPHKRDYRDRTWCEYFFPSRVLIGRGCCVYRTANGINSRSVWVELLGRESIDTSIRRACQAVGIGNAPLIRVNYGRCTRDQYGQTERMCLCAQKAGDRPATHCGAPRSGGSV